jgi:hypothetical protein
MYMKIIWFITDQNTIDFLKSNTPQHTKEVLESLGRRGSLDVQELAHRLVMFKL